MAIVGTILQGVVKHKKGSLDKRQINFDLQKKTLKKLLTRAKGTEFGRTFNFAEILESVDFLREFQKKVPLYDYEKLYFSFWHKLLEGKSNICWPGKVKYFGLTSGTSNDSSKRVPVTQDMIRSIRRTGIRQLLSLAEFELPHQFYEKSVLMLGGSTQLVKMEKYFEGDLSGILTGRLPFWFNRFYKPGAISKERDWNTKLDKIVKKAIDWDIGGIAGVPAWVQILLERIIQYYGVKNIHEIWPNFMVYSHGGVCLAPYKKSFQRLMGKEIYFLETYLASEGFLAYQRKKDRDMQLVLDNGIFFEFIPFDADNFTPEGQLVEHPRTMLLNEVEEGVNYAVIISTNAGAWRYMIGDTIKFVSVKDYEIIITGRIKHFLSLCGEHLSVDNMTKAISIVSDKLNINIKEFTVAGIPCENLFAHKWYIGTDDPVPDTEAFAYLLDDTIRKLNDDYAVERKEALKRVVVEFVPSYLFIQWLKLKGKEGGQNKFPRVIGERYKEWEEFLQQNR
ncbi:MAG: GH3 auxin-responsive promoter family protein [Bacteroidales bacterium]|nr:GH3 auxin-responsive promoter family protein [Bacteroidales bacterium]